MVAELIAELGWPWFLTVSSVAVVVVAAVVRIVITAFSVMLGLDALDDNFWGD